jgi:hypothetical protein
VRQVQVSLLLARRRRRVPVLSARKRALPVRARSLAARAPVARLTVNQVALVKVVQPPAELGSAAR